MDCLLGDKLNMNNKDREIFVRKYFDSISADRLKMVLDTCDNEPFLYRYRPMKEEYDFQALDENYFWQQSLNHLNDEDEGLAFLTYLFVKKSKSDIMKKISNQNPERAKQIITKANIDMKNELRKIRTGWGTICFSESFNCDKMWIEYANRYQGICIKYSKRLLIENNFHLVPVLYKKSKPITDYFKIDEDKNNEILIETIDHQIEKIFLTKILKRWGYEREWRHIDLISKGSNIIDQGSCISAVKPEEIYIGYNCSAENQERIIQYCILHNIRYSIQEQ